MTDSAPSELPPSGQAGYFPDPDDSRYKRYFDGQQWTDRRVLIEQLPETGPHPYRDQEARTEDHQKPSFGNIAAPGAPPTDDGQRRLGWRIRRRLFFYYGFTAQTIRRPS